jgi:hypothetical protein
MSDKKPRQRPHRRPRYQILLPAGPRDAPVWLQLNNPALWRVVGFPIVLHQDPRSCRPRKHSAQSPHFTKPPFLCQRTACTIRGREIRVSETTSRPIPHCVVAPLQLRLNMLLGHALRKCRWLDAETLGRKLNRWHCIESACMPSSPSGHASNHSRHPDQLELLTWYQAMKATTDAVVLGFRACELLLATHYAAAISSNPSGVKKITLAPKRKILFLTGY